MLLDYIGHSCNQFPIGGFAFFRADGVAEIAVQGVPVPSGSGDFDQMADSPLHPGCGGVEYGIYRNIGDINALMFIGLFII